MPTLEDVSRIVSRLPGAAVSSNGLAFEVPNKGKLKGFAWAWNERVEPKKARIPNPNVLVVVVRNLSEKEMLLNSDEETFFTEPHYNGYPAVFVRLPIVEATLLEDLIVEAWRCKAPSELVKQLQ